jgi:ABC-type sugar transport system ATPase subunit
MTIEIVDELVALLDLPDRGRVVFDGEDATARPPGARGVGFVFQSYALFEPMSVHENVAFALRVRGERDARASGPIGHAPRGSRRSPRARASLIFSGLRAGRGRESRRDARRAPRQSVQGSASQRSSSSVSRFAFFDAGGGATGASRC